VTPPQNSGQPGAAYCRGSALARANPALSTAGGMPLVGDPVAEAFETFGAGGRYATGAISWMLSARFYVVTEI